MTLSPQSPAHVSPEPITMGPVSLLWAHQLRREHKSLVSRLTELESSNAKSAESVGNLLGKLSARMDALESLVGEIKGETGRISGTVDMLRAERQGIESERVDVLDGRVGEIRAEMCRISDAVDGLRAEREARQLEWADALDRRVDSIKAEMARIGQIVESLRTERNAGEIEKLLDRKFQEKVREGFKEDIVLLKESLAEWKMMDKRKSHNEPEGETQVPRSVSIPQTQQSYIRESRQRDIAMDIPSTLSGTPTASRLSTPIGHPCASPLQVPDSVPLPSEPAQQFPPQSSPVPSPSEPECLLSALSQGSLSLSAYLERGSSIMYMFPSRRDESRVIQAIWEGLANEEVKQTVEQELENQGWTWNIFQKVLVGLIDKEETLNKDQGQAGSRRKRRRRMIPVVWPDEEYDA